jgi:cytochrome oxidase Cu insertion factor (SCO1/SenC/PrrC family)
MLRILIVAAFGLLLAAGSSGLLTTRPAQAAETAPAAAKAAPRTETELLGQSAPQFTLVDFDGKEHSLADFAGKVVVLDWFNYSCPVVKAYYNDEAFVETMNTALEGQDDVVWVSVVSSAPGKEGYDPAGNKQAFTDFGKVNLTLRDEDGTVGHAYGATATPTVFVIGKDGKVVYAGSFDQATSPHEAPKGTNFVLAAVEAARADSAPEVDSNPAFGCSVKYAK